MSDYKRLYNLIADGSDDKAATRELSILLGAEYETQPISNQGGGFHEVQVKPPSCGYVALDNLHIAVLALETLTSRWSLSYYGLKNYKATNFLSHSLHSSKARAVWMLFVDLKKKDLTEAAA